eukprot:3512940-Prymnesium_polylepis.1
MERGFAATRTVRPRLHLQPRLSAVRMPVLIRRQFGLYLVYCAFMLTLGAAEGLMASVAVYYGLQ